MKFIALLNWQKKEPQYYGYSRQRLCDLPSLDWEPHSFAPVPVSMNFEYFCITEGETSSISDSSWLCGINLYVHKNEIPTIYLRDVFGLDSKT